MTVQTRKHISDLSITTPGHVVIKSCSRTVRFRLPGEVLNTSNCQNAIYANISFYYSSDEGIACGFPDSKAQRERFAERYDFSITLSTKQNFESGYHYFGARFYDSEALTGSKNKVGAEVSTSTGTLSIIQNGSDGNAYTRFSIDATSGGYGNGSLENGAYTVNHGRRRSAKEEPGYALRGFGFSFDIIPHFVTQRTNLRIHPDGNKRGTLGCIGLNAELSVLMDFYDTLRNYINNYSTTYNHNGQSEKGLLLTVDIYNNVNNKGNNPNNVNQNE